MLSLLCHASSKAVYHFLTCWHDGNGIKPWCTDCEAGDCDFFSCRQQLHGCCWLIAFMFVLAKPSNSATHASLRRLKEVVSDEMRNERVGMWVRTQLNQDYDGELPMG